MAGTIVYLPVIPIVNFIGTPAMLPELKNRISGLLGAGGYKGSVAWPPGSFQALSASDADGTIGCIHDHLGAKRRGDREVQSLERALAGLRILRQAASDTQYPGFVHDVELLFGTDWPSIKSKIITNSYRSDVHFLPRDEQEGGFVALPHHSVVLFR